MEANLVKKYLRIANIIASFGITIFGLLEGIGDGIGLGIFLAYFCWAAWWGVQDRLEAALIRWRSEKDVVSAYDFFVAILLGFVFGFLGLGIIKFIRYLREGWGHSDNERSAG
jgi:hypothetical protein